VLIRPAVAEDLRQLVAVEQSATSLYYGSGFSEAQVQPRSEAELRDLLNRTSMHVVEESGALIGYVSFFQTGPYLHLEELAVRRDSQGRGLGTQLLAHYVDEAHKTPGCTHLSLIVFRRAIWACSLYRRFGFRTIEATSSAAIPSPDLLNAIVRAEAAAGLDPTMRQLMVRPTRL
jgi:ribosomal protein S18 acetylase RimI-like enzyme